MHAGSSGLTELHIFTGSQLWKSLILSDLSAKIRRTHRCIECLHDTSNKAVLRLLMQAVGPLTRAAILLYALAGAALYCGMLPLWEGFDELYHYGYVQYVSTWAAFPIAGRSALSRELWSSLDYAPLSSYIQPYVHRPTTNFQDYFALSDAERARRRQAMDTIPRELQREASTRENYEAKHAPLTSRFLAPLDRLLSSAPLSDRVLVLRLVLSLASIVPCG